MSEPHFSPAVTGLDAENPGREKCDNKQSLHIYNLELLDLCQVSGRCNGVLLALSEKQREITIQQQNLHTHPLVVIFNLCCHANLHHQRGVLLTVLSKDEISILASEVLWCAHEEHLPPARGLALLLPHLRQDKGQRQENSSSSPGATARSQADRNNSTLAFFLMCFSRGCTVWGPGWDKAPKEYFFRGGRWNCRSFMGPMWVGKNGWRSSTAGMECWYRTQAVLRGTCTTSKVRPSSYPLNLK